MPNLANQSRALLTGATGFIGRNMVRHLREAGWQVGALSRSDNLPLGVQRYLYEGATSDVMHAVADFRPNVVFHLASLFLSDHTPDQIEPLVASNILLGTQVLEAIRAAGVDRFVNVGTNWQNYSGDDYLPVNLYSATKQAFADILLYYVETAGINAVTLKLFDSYGPGDTRRKLLRLLLDTLRSGEPLAMSAGEQLIDLAHVDDICSALLRAAELTGEESQMSNTVYAVSGGQRQTLREVVATLERVAGQNLAITWGARPYREREVMHPWSGPPIPGWQPRITLENGLRSLLQSEGF